MKLPYFVGHLFCIAFIGWLNYLLWNQLLLNTNSQWFDNGLRKKKINSCFVDNVYFSKMEKIIAPKNKLFKMLVFSIQVHLLKWDHPDQRWKENTLYPFCNLYLLIYFIMSYHSSSLSLNSFRKFIDPIQLLSLH